MKTRTAMLAAALVALLLAVAAVASGCGSTSSDDGVAALDDAAATTSEGDGSQATTATMRRPEEVALAWAKCMREHGIDVPDPEVDENGRVRVMIQGRRAAEGVRDDAFEKAREECGTPFGDAGPAAALRGGAQEMQETMLEFAACMREHGVDMPDPDFSGGGGACGFGGADGVDPQSSTFQKAQEACQEILEDAFGDAGRGSGSGAARSDEQPSTNRDGGVVRRAHVSALRSGSRRRDRRRRARRRRLEGGSATAATTDSRPRPRRSRAAISSCATRSTGRSGTPTPARWRRRRREP